ncbi:hypothetical protein XELAEV_18016117mg [Xenopus laevis]|uniref:SPRY domain-containing protein 7 n=1 Tax=Xenopus laevis TaxID=8355 RepID=A0A974HWU7_XENLA|nr:hypothetical protein XELAEV_18016117mg [Xenopus laevis]
MANVLCCFRCCVDDASGHIPLKEMPAVQLDTQHMGTDVVIVKNGRRICGTGACLANAPLHQNKSYFEFKVQSTGIWGIGVATQKANLNQIPLGRDVHSLVMRNDGTIYYNNEEKNSLPANGLPQEGDVVLLVSEGLSTLLFMLTTAQFWTASLASFITPLQLDLRRFSLSSRFSKDWTPSAVTQLGPHYLKLQDIYCNVLFVSLMAQDFQGCVRVFNKVLTSF